MNIIPWRQRGKGELSRVDDRSPLSSLRTEIDQLFDRFFSDPFAALSSRSFLGSSWLPSVDVSENGKDVTVKVEVPGVSPESINVSLNGSLLTIEGEKKEENEEQDKNFYRSERSFGSFCRTIELPPNIDGESVSAEHNNGVLKIRIAKQKGAEAKRIPVTAAKS